eukprot:TRINITY_DN10290_c0_g1_i1.p1 TRINITY_DN10290_c0_g1~~TRINITY_DN10290_c0_g1_i1.p1  ORF type:complete len:475 (-),score=41.26 TRINITY_DN10290_c0_g1_i1:17-1396(-)
MVVSSVRLAGVVAISSLGLLLSYEALSGNGQIPVSPVPSAAPRSSSPDSPTPVPLANPTSNIVRTLQRRLVAIGAPTPEVVFDLGSSADSWALLRQYTGATIITAPLSQPAQLTNPFARVASDDSAGAFVLARATAHRLRSLAATLNFFDLQLALSLHRIREANLVNFSLATFLGDAVPMAKLTYLTLPADQTAEDIDAAVQRALDSNYTVGVKRLHWKASDITPEGETDYRLVEVRVHSMIRGTRQTWCVHEEHEFMGRWLKDHKLKYDFRFDEKGPSYSVGVLQSAGYRVTKDLSREWLPAFKLKDLLGWGISRDQRILLLAQQLATPQYPDFGSHNWVVYKGRAVRIDKTDRAGSRSIAAPKYLQRLASELCLDQRSSFNGECASTCGACLRNTMHFSWIKTKDPPQECKACGKCERTKLSRQSLAAILSGDEAADCNVEPDMKWVAVGEHKCHPY